jgi:Zn finger protein HypA/HybF involved in hydrogenase expression
LCEEWAHEKFQHKTITAGYDKKVKWKCNDCDLIWSATVYHRAHEGTGCPVCMGHEIHPDGRNSLGVLYPELVKEWDDEKISPFEIRESSNNKINWKCIGCNYKWKTAVANRTGKNATGCPQCADWGFNPDEPAFYYAMEIKGHNGNWWWKGGVTCNLERRRRDIQGSLLSNGMDLKVVIVDFLEFDKGEKALKFEKLLLSINDIRVTCKEKFDGSNELFNINPLEHATTNGIAINGKNPQTKLSSWLS